MVRVTSDIRAIEVLDSRGNATLQVTVSLDAVALGGGQIKAGAPCHGERIAECDRLIEIEPEIGWVYFPNPFAR